MTQKKKIVIMAGVLISGAVITYIVSQDANRKRYNNTVVPMQYAIDAMKKK